MKISSAEIFDWQMKVLEMKLYAHYGVFCLCMSDDTASCIVGLIDRLAIIV